MGGFVRGITGVDRAKRDAEEAGVNQSRVVASGQSKAKDRLLSQFGAGLDSFKEGSFNAQDTLGVLLTGALDDISSSSSGAQAQLQPFADVGRQASQREAALSGALGNEAQQAAFQSFNESPGQAFLREQGEKAALRGASSQGRSLGGSVLAELQRRGTGLAQQDFGNQMARLSSIAGRGQNASSDIANIIRGSGAQNVATRTGLGQNIANLQLGRGATEFQARQSLGSNLANAALGGAASQANIIGNVGQAQANAALAGGQATMGLIGELIGAGKSLATGGVGGGAGGAGGQGMIPGVETGAQSGFGL